MPEVKVWKSGTGLAIFIPKSLVKDLGIEKGSFLEAVGATLPGYGKSIVLFRCVHVPEPETGSEWRQTAEAPT